MKKLLKQALLRFGGYTFARNIYTGIEEQRLMQRARKFIRTGLTPLPDMVMFEPTQRCNLNCRMCFQDHGLMARQRELTPDQIADFFDRYPYLKKVTLIGGEIFLRSDIMDIIRFLDNTRDIVLSTNATLIHDSDIDMLRHCRHIFGICISLDGPKAIHELIRNAPGSFDATAHATEELAKCFPVTVNCVIQNDNIKVLPEVVDLCAALGVRKLNFELERIYSEDIISQTVAVTGLERVDLPVSSKGRSREYSLNYLKKKLAECQSRGRGKGIYVIFAPPFRTDSIDACYAGCRRTKIRHLCQSFSTATIAPDGSLIHCFVIRKTFGNILDTPFDEIWNSQAANNFRKQLIMNNLTPLCENCRSMVPLEKVRLNFAVNPEDAKVA
ncbi:MAG TPA: radical SAM protein [Thermodesulfobacteriota bacterium]|nr:radical SAM protein [Thermodesulfobacteriota bacterium]